MERWALGAMIGGGTLIVVSWFLPLAARQVNGWTDEKARDHAEAAAAVHQLSHERAHAADNGKGKPDPAYAKSHADPHDPPDPQAEARLEEAKKRYEQTSANLRRAQSAGQGFAWLLRWIGVLGIVGGGAGYLWLRRPAE